MPVQCGPRGLRGSGDSLYRNRRDGTFEDVTTRAGVTDPAGRFGLGVSWSDFNHDGRPDMFVANDAGPNFLYRNNGDGTFADVALAAGTALDENGKVKPGAPVKFAFPHCDKWSPRRSCPWGSIATGLRADTEGELGTVGIALRCHKLAAR